MKKMKPQLILQAYDISNVQIYPIAQIMRDVGSLSAQERSALQSDLKTLHSLIQRNEVNNIFTSKCVAYFMTDKPLTIQDAMHPPNRCPKK